MSTTSKTKVRNAMGKAHKTVPQLAKATGLSEGVVRRRLHRDGRGAAERRGLMPPDPKVVTGVCAVVERGGDLPGPSWKVRFG